MTLTIQLPENVEAALKEQANARGVSPADYVREIVERNLAASTEKQSDLPPFKTGYGMLAKYGPAPSAEEIDANRAEMFRHFAED
jgi:plasmid stability protein